MSRFAGYSPSATEQTLVTKQDAGKHASSPTKTPISSLQEFCQKLGKTPQYDLTAMEGRAHQPQFVYRCTVGDVTRTGQGGSKKAAKHAAAEAVLTTLRGGPDEEDTAEVPEDVPSPSSTQDEPSHADSANPVGTLQELVVAKGWRLPVYSLYAESGPAHKKEFIMCCTVESFKEYGSGSAKKHAKRSAATKMHSKILNLPPDAESRVEVGDKVKPVAFDILHNSAGEKIIPISLDDPININFCQFLQKVAEYANFSVEYYDIDQSSLDGKCQCMAMITTQPALVVHGEGETNDDAHANAASSAIKMLKIFFQRIAKKDVKKESADK